MSAESLGAPRRGGRRFLPEGRRAAEELHGMGAEMTAVRGGRLS